MKHRRLLAWSVALSGLLPSGIAFCATPASGIASVWFGAFNNTMPDGKVSHDESVLVLEQDGSKLSGSVGPTMERLSPILDASMKGDEISFRIEGGGGIAFVLHRSAGHIVGTAKGSRINAVLDMTPAPGLMPQAQLVAEITAADARSFAAYESCNPEQYRATLSPDLEFYQDNQPLKNQQQIIDSLNYRCAEGIQLRRVLDAPSLIINATAPYYAIEAGIQRIYSKQPDGSEHLDATVRFTLVWSKKSGTWQIVRAVSYDHR